MAVSPPIFSKVKERTLVFNFLGKFAGCEESASVLVPYLKRIPEDGCGTLDQIEADFCVCSTELCNGGTSFIVPWMMLMPSVILSKFC